MKIGALLYLFFCTTFSAGNSSIGYGSLTFNGTSQFFSNSQVSQSLVHYDNDFISIS